MSKQIYSPEGAIGREPRTLAAPAFVEKGLQLFGRRRQTPQVEIGSPGEEGVGDLGFGLDAAALEVPPNEAVDRMVRSDPIE